MICINSMAHVSGFQSRLRSLQYLWCNGRILLSPSPHSLGGNSIGDKGAKVLSDAIKTMGNLQELQ